MYWDGGGWAWMAFMPLVWIVLIGVIVWAVIRLAQHGGHGPEQHRWGPPRETPEKYRWGPPRETPEEILDRRFASGEIDADTYTEARERLAAHRPPPRRPD